MGFLMAGQPGANWIAIAAFVLGGANFLGLGALFAWISEKTRKPKDH